MGLELLANGCCVQAVLTTHCTYDNNKGDRAVLIAITQRHDWGLIELQRNS